MRMVGQAWQEEGQKGKDYTHCDNPDDHHDGLLNVRGACRMPRGQGTMRA